MGHQSPTLIERVEKCLRHLHNYQTPRAPLDHSTRAFRENCGLRATVDNGVVEKDEILEDTTQRVPSV